MRPCSCGKVIDYSMLLNVSDFSHSTRASTRNQGKSQMPSVELASASGGTGMTLRAKPTAKTDAGKVKDKAKLSAKGRK